MFHNSSRHFFILRSFLKHFSLSLHSINVVVHLEIHLTPLLFYFTVRHQFLTFSNNTAFNSRSREKLLTSY